MGPITGVSGTHETSKWELKTSLRGPMGLPGLNSNCLQFKVNYKNLIKFFSFSGWWFFQQLLIIPCFEHGEKFFHSKLGDIDDEFREKYCRIRLKCKNFGMGCIEIFEIDNLEMHESSCQFSKDHYYQCQCGQTVNKKGNL